MIHIIFAGDSFSSNLSDTLNLDYLIDNNFSFNSILNVGVIMNYMFFALDLINQQKKDLRIYTIGRPSYGNHVISDKFKNKVKQIQTEYPNDLMYGIIQFSGFVRNTKSHSHLKIDLKKYQYDYIDYSKSHIIDEKEIFEKHFNNIENLYSFCKMNNIETYMYFGWANIFEKDIQNYNLYNRIEKINEIVDFQEYSESEDEIDFYCIGKKPKDIIKFSSGIKLYRTFGDLYGGLTEYARSKLPVGKRYIYLFDPHPSSQSNYIFYKDKIKKWLISKNIIDDTILNTEIEDKIKTIFDFEYFRSTILINATSKHFEDISSISNIIINKDVILNPDEYKKIFYDLNKKYKES